MRRAIRVRCYPEEDQLDRLVSQWGAVRFVWNKALAAMSHRWRVHGHSLDPVHDLKKMLAVAKRSRRYGWLAEHDAMALQQALINLGKARSAFFERRARYPRFKSRHGRQSSYHCTGKLGWGLDESGHLKGNGWISIPKMPGPIRAQIHREIDPAWVLKSITMSRTPTGKVFATLLFETGLDAPAPRRTIDPDRVMGLDLGLADLATLSSGEKIPNPRHVRKAEKRLRRRQRVLSRKTRGSANRAKARLKVARAHADLAHARSDHLHKLSRHLVDDNQAIGTESLRVTNMMKNRRLARAIGDAGWGELVRQVAYKAAWAGKHHVKIDTFAPSTKLCSSCGVLADHLALKDRIWVCACGATHDRDINAAINIQGMAIVDLRAKGYVVRRRNSARTPLETV